MIQISAANTGMPQNKCTLELSALKNLNKTDLLLFLVILFSLSGALLDIQPASKQSLSAFPGNGSFTTQLANILLSLPGKDAFFLLATASFSLFLIARFSLREGRHIKLCWTVIPAFFVSVSFIAGRALSESNDLGVLISSGSQIAKSIWIVLGVWFIASIIILFINTLVDRIIQSNSLRQLTNPLDRLPFLRNHPVASIATILFLFWSPTLIGFYPGLFMGDTGAQINQWFNNPNWVSNYLNLVDPNVMLNNHHPVLHTAIMGSFVWLGETLFGSDNIGFFLYILFQHTVGAFALAYAVAQVQKLGAPSWTLIMAIGFCGLVPFFGQYASLGTKDFLFSCCTVLVFVFLVRLIKENYQEIEPSEYAVFSIALLGFLFLRNGTLVFAVAGFGLAILFSQKNRAVYGAILAASVLVYVLVSSLLFPLLHITHTSQREMLSVPMQQISRCVTEHEDEIPEDVERWINDVLDYNNIPELYNPLEADPVKATWNENATKEDVTNFFRAWGWCLTTYPSTCVEATAANYFGLFYFCDTNTSLYSLASSTRRMDDSALASFDFHHLNDPVSKFVQSINFAYIQSWQHVPLLSIFTSSAFYFWAIVLALLWTLKNNRKEWVAFAFIFLVTAVALIGPMNPATYIRYTIPTVFAFPFFFALLFAPRQAERSPQQRVNEPKHVDVLPRKESK